MHLLMCAIHSDFSVGVAANTANDFLGLMICQPFFQAINGEGERGREREKCKYYVQRTVLVLIYITPYIAWQYVKFCVIGNYNNY